MRRQSLCRLIPPALARLVSLALSGQTWGKRGYPASALIGVNPVLMSKLKHNSDPAVLYGFILKHA